jgi:pimeloyl-ACP methyl ester carboxylesterase
VLLRGLVRSAAHWGNFPARLQAACGGRVVCIELPGNGAAHAHASPTTIAAMREAVRAQLRAAGVDAPVRVLAVSMGGMVAVDWAASHPDELQGVVLVSSSLRGVSRITQRLRPACWPRLLALWLTSASASAWERTIHELTSVDAARRDEVVARWVELRRREPVSRANALRQLMAAARYAAPARPTAVPMLVLAGQADRLVDPACSITLAERWGAPLLLHPAAGHDLPLDQPDWLIDVLRRWQPDQPASILERCALSPRSFGTVV